MRLAHLAKHPRCKFQILLRRSTRRGIQRDRLADLGCHVGHGAHRLEGGLLGGCLAVVGESAQLRRRDPRHDAEDKLPAQGILEAWGGEDARSLEGLYGNEDDVGLVRGAYVVLLGEDLDSCSVRREGVLYTTFRGLRSDRCSEMVDGEGRGAAWVENPGREGRS